MSGYFGVVSKKIVCLICFSARIIIPIWEPAGPVWLCTGKTVSIGLFTTLKILLSVLNLTTIFTICAEIWASVVFLILKPSP